VPPAPQRCREGACRYRPTQIGNVVGRGWGRGNPPDGCAPPLRPVNGYGRGQIRRYGCQTEAAAFARSPVNFYATKRCLYRVKYPPCGRYTHGVQSLRAPNFRDSTRFVYSVSAKTLAPPRFSCELTSSRTSTRLLLRSAASRRS
jgi:hypothetical protein